MIGIEFFYPGAEDKFKPPIEHDRSKEDNAPKINKKHTARNTQKGNKSFSGPRQYLYGQDVTNELRKIRNLGEI